MNQNAFDQIMEGAREALEIAKGEAVPARWHWGAHEFPADVIGADPYSVFKDDKWMDDPETIPHALLIEHDDRDGYGLCVAVYFVRYWGA